MLLSVIFLFQGCGPVEPQQSYYAGETVSYFAENGKKAQEISRAHLLYTRTLDRENSIITERSITSEQDGKPQEVVVDMNVTGNSFELSSRSGSFKGRGSLSGEPWKWEAWTTETVFMGGSSVKTQSRFNKTGIFTSKKFLSPSGETRVIFEENLKQISPDQFKMRHASMVQGGSVEKETGE